MTSFVARALPKRFRLLLLVQRTEIKKPDLQIFAQVTNEKLLQPAAPALIPRAFCKLATIGVTFAGQAENQMSSLLPFRIPELSQSVTIFLKELLLFTLRT